MSKDDIISKVYFDPAGYGSINQTLQDAKKYVSTITYDDVKKWKEKHTERKTNLRGQNSCIAHHAAEEYQMDNMFFTDLKDPEYIGGLLMVDIFTKYTVVIPIKHRSISEVNDAIEKL